MASAKVKETVEGLSVPTRFALGAGDEVDGPAASRASVSAGFRQSAIEQARIPVRTPEERRRRVTFACTVSLVRIAEGRKTVSVCYRKQLKPLNFVNHELFSYFVLAR